MYCSHIKYFEIRQVLVTVVQNNVRIIVVDLIPIVCEEHSLPIFFHPGLQAGQSNTISFGSVLLKVALFP